MRKKFASLLIVSSAVIFGFAGAANAAVVKQVAVSDPTGDVMGAQTLASQVDISRFVITQHTNVTTFDIIQPSAPPTPGADFQYTSIRISETTQNFMFKDGLCYSAKDYQPLKTGSCQASLINPRTVRITVSNSLLRTHFTARAQKTATDTTAQTSATDVSAYLAI